FCNFHTLQSNPVGLIGPFGAVLAHGPGHTCLLRPDAGGCQNYTISWFFDTDQGRCSRFWYGGCGGNGNRFNTLTECQSLCVTKAQCLLHADTGIQCEDYVQLWFFDKVIGACSPFWYGGCGGNANRFNTENECVRTLMSTAITSLHPDSCFLSQDQGGCQNYTMMWFFDTEQRECSRFWYGGCGGNGNRRLRITTLRVFRDI
uniref:BPTI/Kunitz inhibitor domain-containing protein n=1 Tax=Sander lucioperca TaxID=283035 RepID=A0A8C9XD59_SANLU